MSEPVRLTATVELELCPRVGQTEAEAREEFAALFQHYLEDRDGSFLTDYGASPEAIAEARERGLSPVWGAYDGPIVTGVSVRPSVA